MVITVETYIQIYQLTVSFYHKLHITNICIAINDINAYRYNKYTSRYHKHFLPSFWVVIKVKTYAFRYNSSQLTIIINPYYQQYFIALHNDTNALMITNAYRYDKSQLAIINFLMPTSDLLYTRMLKHLARTAHS